MKLLIVTQVVDKNHPILGFFHRWIEEFAKNCEKVTVICLQKGEYSLPDNVEVYSLGKEEGKGRLVRLWRFYKYFINIFFIEKIDYVFFHMGAVFNILASPFFMVRRLFNTKFYWWKAHGKINQFGKLALLFVNTVVTSTESGFSVESQKKRVVGQAIDTALFTVTENYRNNKNILFTGRIMPVKNLEIFIAVANILHQEGYTFTIAGPVGDSDYFSTLRSLPGSEYVKFIDPMPQHELVKLYQKASIFLNTSITHSMDKTVLEAVLCGCLPITSNKAFENMLGKYNLYYPQQTTEGYVEAIRLFTNCDTDNIREELRKDVRNNHSIDTFINRIFN